LSVPSQDGFGFDDQKRSVATEHTTDEYSAPARSVFALGRRNGIVEETGVVLDRPLTSSA
jgi:hypothetical protein